MDGACPIATDGGTYAAGVERRCGTSVAVMASADTDDPEEG